MVLMFFFVMKIFSKAQVRSDTLLAGEILAVVIPGFHFHSQG